MALDRLGVRNEQSRAQLVSQLAPGDAAIRV